jgi:hypothetical protein
MFIPFQNITDSARIWIYQAEQKLSAEKQAFINNFLTQYCEQWKAHGAPLKSSFSIQRDYFIIMAADENFNSTSGCSIDDSVRAIKEIEQQTGIGFFNRNLVAFEVNNGVMLVPLGQLKEKFVSGMWNGETPTFNNLVDTKAKLANEWVMPAGKTCLKRYIPAQKIHS